jgi:PAS domain S-box-containing protein
MAEVKILLVENESIKAMDIKRTLESFSYNVPYVASSCKEAIEQALVIIPDLILMDIVLKGTIDSIEAVSKIKKLNIPVIFLISHSEESKIERSKLTEPFEYIIKPYKLNELKYAIKLAIYKNIMEKKLKASEKEYRSIIETTHEGVAIDTPEGGFTYVNSRFEDMIGFKKEELIGQDVLDLLSHDQIPLIRNSRKRLHNGEKFEMQCKFHRKDGSILWTIAQSSPLYDDNGKHIANLAMHTDITERKSAEQKLAERAFMLANINEAVIGTDVNYHINYWNKSAEKMYGYSKEEIIGLYSDILKPKFFGLTKEEAIKQLETVGNLNVELIHTTKNGREIIVDSRNQTLYDEAGNRYGIIGINRDVTERKKNDEKLKLASLYNRSLIEASLDPLVTIGPDGKVTDVNKATETVTGYSRDEIIGSDFSYYFTEPLKAKEGYRQVFKEGFIRDYPLEIQHKDGYVTPVLYNASVYRDESGNVVGVFAAARDIIESKKAENELKLASLYNRSLIEASLDPLVTIGSDGKVTDVNKATETVTGYSRDEIIGSDFSDYFTEPEKAKNGYKKSFYEGFVKDYPLEIQHKEGFITPVLYNASVYKDESCEIIGVFAAARDITEYKKAEDALRESEKKYRDIFEESFDGLFITSPEGKILDMNKRGIEMFGYNTKEEILSLNLVEDVYADPNDRKKILKIVNEQESSEYEVVVKKKNGDKMITRCSLSAVKDKGVITDYRGIIRDITESKEAENDIIHAKEEWENTFNAVPDLIAILDTNFRVVRANKAMANRLNVTPEETIGLTCYEVVHGLNSAPSFCPYSKLLEDGQEHTAEVHEDLLGGDFIVSVSPLHDKDGKHIGVVHVARDITKRKQTENEIKKSLDEKEVLLREIHHRVKNNLQIIASLLNLQECGDDKGANDILSESMGRVKTMATIHEKLYESPSLSEINFKEFTEKLVYDILYSYGIQKNLIKTNLIIEDINLNIDTAIPLGLIINELVTNIVKYAFPNSKGIITIKLNSLPEHMELTIADDGIGFPKDVNMKNIDTLGLELVKNLVNQLEGNLILNRKNGTEFKITFKEVKYKERL